MSVESKRQPKPNVTEQVSVVHVAPSASESPKSRLEYELERNLQWIEYWQKILRLQDWEITHEVVTHQHKMDGAYADINWDETLKQAHIRILADNAQFGDALSNPKEELDQEWTLVHELLHLYTFGLAPERNHEAEEWMINSISRALVRLNRKCQK